MADIVCSFSLPCADPQFFIVDQRVNVSQLREFLLVNHGVSLDVTIHHNDVKVESTEQLALALQSEQPVHFDIQQKQPEVIPVEPLVEPNIQPEVPENKDSEPVFVLGGALQSIFDRFGIHFDLEHITELHQQVPFPILQFVLHQNCTARHVQFLALFCQVSAEELASDINNLLSFIEKSKVKSAQSNVEQNREQDIDQIPVVQEQPESNQKHRHSATCDNCNKPIIGIRYKCLRCDDYDLCEECEILNCEQWFHDESHVFAKIHKPRHIVYQRIANPSFQCGKFREMRNQRIENLEKQVAELKQMVSNLKQ